MKSGTIRNLEALPGPLWLFGAYGICRMWNWLLALLVGLVGHGVVWQGWSVLAIGAGGLLAAALPVVLLWLLASRNAYALPLVRWYASVQAIYHLIAVFAPLFDAGAGWLAEFINGAWVVCWGALMLWLERSPAVAQLFPAAERRSCWWAVAVIVVAVFVYG